MFRLNNIQQRRWNNFRANTRAFWSLWIFLFLFLFTFFAEIVANDKPLLASYRGELLVPMLTLYPGTKFNDWNETEANYRDPVLQCLLRTGGHDQCLDEDPAFFDAVARGEMPDDAEPGWMIWPLIGSHHSSISITATSFPGPPSADHWLGTDDTGRDVMARSIYGFRLSVLFGFFVTFCSAVIGLVSGAAQGFFGGWVDLVFQRIVEIWSSMNTLYIILIISAVLTPNVWILASVFVVFGWTALIGVVRAEFLRARNFEYVRAARALGVGNWTIMFRHLLPNAMVATLTVLPFMLTGSIGLLAGLDYLGFGLGSAYPSLGELALQAKNNLTAPWLALTAFLTFAIMLSLLVFIFEGIRDAFDPRKTFR